MANFCIHCGRPLSEGETCNCTGAAAAAEPTPTPQKQVKFCTRCGKPLAADGTCSCQPSNGGAEVVQDMVKKVGDGISNSEMLNGTWYERGTKIVPDNICSNDGEVPVKQYDFAVLRSRIKFMRAEGRLQVTNKRLLFRATGRSLRGKTVLQHEFAIDEIGGIEIKKDYRFSFIDLFLMFILLSLTNGLIAAIVSGLLNSVWVLAIFVSLALAAGSVFLAVKNFKNYLLNTILLSGTAMSMSLLGTFTRYARYGSTFLEILGGFILFIALMYLLASIATLYLFSFKSNLSIDIKVKGGVAPIAVKSNRNSIFTFGMSTGYNETLPAKDTDLAIKEVGAMISDIQKLGDFGIQKWKSN